MKKDVLDYYKLISYRRLLDYLLLKDNVEDEFLKYKNIILTEEFLAAFQTMITNINNSSISYPEITHKNSIKLLDYIDDNSSLNIYPTRVVVSNMNDFSNEKYNYEYLTKQLSISMESLNDAIVWKKEDIEESLLYDFIVTMSLNTSENDFLTEYLPNFIFKKNVVFSINKILKENKILLTDKEIKRKIRTIIKSNLSILSKLNDESRDEIISFYVSNNYKGVDTISFYNYELDIFSELNKNALNMINNSKIDPFNIESIHQYYDYLKIEHYLYSDDKHYDNLLIDNIYFYIDNAKSISLEGKKKLLDLLKIKKDNLNENEIALYNKYVNKLNLKNINKDSDIIYEFKTRSNLFTYINANIQMKKGDDTLYKKVLSSRGQDLYNFELLINDEKYFNNNIMYANLLSFQYSLKKFMSEYPNMFLNDIILSHALTVINKYDDLDASVIRKKLKKIKKA